jgi:chromosome partitioning protein
MNQKGGVGKTTTTVNIGALLAGEHGKKVLMVDLDPQGNLSDHVGIDPSETEKSIYNVLIDATDPRDVMQTCHGMDIIPSNIHLSGAELELAGMLSRESRLKNGIGKIVDNYDYVLIDCPPSLGLLTVSALTFADEVIVPMQAEYLALRGLGQLVQTVDLVKTHLNDRLKVSGVIFCMFDGRTNLARDVKAEVEEHLPGKVYSTAIRKNVRLGEAPSHGMPINIYDATCAGCENYRAVTREFLARECDSGPEPHRRQPIWKADEEGEEFLAVPESAEAVDETTGQE